MLNNSTPSLRGVDVAVIGGGAVGVCSALELARRGASVALLERGPQLAWECSAGNAGIVGPGHVVPLADPAAVRAGLRWMTQPDSPFYVRPRPAVVPWLGRFAAAATPQRMRAAHSALRSLALHSASMHAAFADGGLDARYRRSGMLNVFAREKPFQDACAEARQDSQDGLHNEILTAGDVARRLQATRGRIAGGVLYRDEAHCDPLAFVNAVGEAAQELGVEIRTGVEVLDVRVRDGRVQSLWTTEGDLAVGELVVAAGVWSRRVASSLGIHLPIEPAKGYHFDVAADAGDVELPIWLHEDRVVITPLGERIRFAGTLELSGFDGDISRRRVEAIRAAVARLLPHVAARPAVDIWRGLRPCTPDGLPIVGPVAGIDGLTFATGHGMWGLQLAPVTGLLVGEVLAGLPPSHDMTPFRPERFGAFAERARMAGTSHRAA